MPGGSAPPRGDTLTSSWLVLALLAAAAPVEETLHLAARSLTLENGLRVVVHEDHRAPLVAVHVRYGVGSAEDERAGMAHLVEHLLSEGSKNAPAGAFDRLLAAAGAENNAWTDHDALVCHTLLPAPYLDLALFLESDRMGWMVDAIDEADLENQLAVVGEERAMDADAPGGMDAVALNAATWPAGHPYHRAVLGTADSLAGVSLDEVRAWTGRWLQPGNASLVIAGDVEADAALDRARYWFGDVPGHPPPDRAPGEPPPRPGRWLLVDGLDRSTLYAAWPTVPRGHEDEPALDLLAELLAGGRGTRLPDALVFGRGRFEEVRAWTDNNRLGGTFAVRLVRRGGRAEGMRRALDRQLARFARNPPSTDEVDGRKTRWRSWYLRATEDLEGRAALLADCLWARGEPDCLAWDHARHMAVTAEDVRRVAARYLADDRRALLAVVPEARLGLRDAGHLELE